MSDQAHDWTDEQIAKMTENIRKVYQQAADEMTEKLGSWLEDYEKELTRWKRDLKEKKVTQEEYDNWLKDQAMHQTWQQAMIDSLTNEAVNADQLCRQLINDELPTVFAENANFGGYDVDTKLGYDTRFTLVDRDTVLKLIKDQPQLLPMPKVDKAKDTRWNQQKFAGAVTQGILQGESVPNMAKRLMSVFGMDERASIKAARTSFTSAENAGRVHSYKRAQGLGIALQQEWLATLDLRTRMTHRLLDGQRVQVGGYFEPEGYGSKYRVRFPGDPQGLPEMVWSCRCTLVASVAGVDVSDAERWSRLPEGMTYDEWKGVKAESTKPKAPNVSELKEALQGREDELQKALNVRKPNDGMETYYRNDIERNERLMRQYEHASSYDYDALMAESMELENRYHELRRHINTLPSSPERDAAWDELDALGKRISAVDIKLNDIKQYERYKTRYEQSKVALSDLLKSNAGEREAYKKAQAAIPSLIRERNSAIRELSEAQPFGPQIREVVGDEFADAMERVLEDASGRHPEIAEMYRMFSSQLSVKSKDNEDGACYKHWTKGIYFNAEKDSAGNSYDRPYEVAFHEFGHLVDNVSMYGSVYSSDGLGDLIKSDWWRFRDELGKADGVRRDKNGHAVSVLNQEKRSRDDGKYAYGNVSDIIEGCIGKSYPLGFGHGASYHKKSPDATANEFFAEVCDSAMTNEASYEQMRRIFPNAVAEVERIVRELVS